MIPISGLHIERDYDEDGEVFIVCNGFGDPLYVTYSQLDAYSWMEAQD